MSNKIYYIGHIGLFTNNPSRLVNFYTKEIGFKKEKQTLIPKKIVQRIFRFPYDCTLISLTNKDAWIEIFSTEQTSLRPRTTRQIGYNHFSIFVKDKVRFCEDLARKRVSIIRVKRNSHFTYFIKDPDGNRIEVQDLLAPLKKK